jgi:hypothetical protein
MICPKGEPVHENLSSEYTDVPQLLSSLRAEGFSGTIEVETSTKKGIFLLSSGEIIEAIVGTEAEPTQTEGNEAVEDLLVFCTQPSVTLSIYRLSALEAEFAASTVHAETVFKGLSTDFVRLDRFIRKLEGERHNGYLEAYTKDNSPVGMILLKDGLIEGALVAFGSGRPDFRRGDAAKAFLEEMNDRSLVFSVYRSTFPVLKTVSIEKEDDRTAGVVETDPAESLAATNGKSNGDASSVHPGFSLDTVSPQNGRGHLVANVEDILSKLETFVNGLSDKGSFQRVFKRACVDKSEFFPFLDPFEGQFDYTDGEMRVDGEISTETLSVGLAECLNLTLSYLQKELPATASLPAGLRSEIDSSLGAYRAGIGKSLGQSVVPAGSSNDSLR